VKNSSTDTSSAAAFETHGVALQRGADRGLALREPNSSIGGGKSTGMVLICGKTLPSVAFLDITHLVMTVSSYVLRKSTIAPLQMQTDPAGVA